MSQENENKKRLESSASEYSGEGEEDFDLNEFFDFAALSDPGPDASSTPQVTAQPTSSTDQATGSGVVTNAASQVPPADTLSTNVIASAEDLVDGPDSGDIAHPTPPGTQNATTPASAFESEQASPLPNSKQLSNGHAETQDSPLDFQASVNRSAIPKNNGIEDANELVATVPEGATATGAAQAGNESKGRTPTPCSNFVRNWQERQKRARCTVDDEVEGKQVVSRPTKRMRTTAPEGRKANPQPTIIPETTSTTSTSIDASTDAIDALQSQILFAQVLQTERMNRMKVFNTTIPIALPPCPNPALARNPYAYTTMMFPTGRATPPPSVAPPVPLVVAHASEPAPAAGAPVAPSSTSNPQAAHNTPAHGSVFIDVSVQYNLPNILNPPATPTTTATPGSRRRRFSIKWESPNKTIRTRSRAKKYYLPTPALVKEDDQSEEG